MITFSFENEKLTFEIILICLWRDDYESHYLTSLVGGVTGDTCMVYMDDCKVSGKNKLSACNRVALSTVDEEDMTEAFLRPCI